jgi:hypothetical protein
MISLLPVSGGFITLANRCLSGAIVILLPWTTTKGRGSFAAGHIGLPMPYLLQYSWWHCKISSNFGIQIRACDGVLGSGVRMQSLRSATGGQCGVPSHCTKGSPDTGTHRVGDISTNGCGGEQTSTRYDWQQQCTQPYSRSMQSDRGDMPSEARVHMYARAKRF